MINTLLNNLPWQEIFNWGAGVLIPVLIGAVKVYVSKHALAKQLLTVVVQGVESGTDSLGNDGRTVKLAVRDASIKAALDLALDNFVQDVTKQDTQTK